MNTLLARAANALQNGTSRAVLVLVFFLVLWASSQLGGLSLYLINSWLTLSLPLIIASIGVTLVMFSGQFDLSAAGVVTLTNVLMATFFNQMNPWLAFVGAIVVGAAIGMINGLLVVVGRLPAIAVTLAVNIVIGGLALVILPTPGGKIAAPLIALFTGPLLIPRSFVIIALLIGAWLVYRRTKFGIFIFAVGQDEESLKLSGISVPRVRIAVFTIAGALYALAGVTLSAVIQSGDASIGSTYLLQSFAAIAIGGTAFVGGSGSVLGTILGALTLTVIPKVLFVLGINGWVQQVFTGALIIGAVLLGAVSLRNARRKKKPQLPRTRDKGRFEPISGGERS
jgi:ribose transport system permease protein